MDEQFDDIKCLYRQKKGGQGVVASATKVAGERQLKRIKRYQGRYALMMALTAGAIIYVDHVSSKAVATSAAGFWLLIACAFYYGICRWVLYEKLRAIDPSMPTVQMIKRLQAYQKLNSLMQTWMQFAYIAVLSLGVYLYLLPLLSPSGRMSANARTLSWLVWFAWLAWVFVHTFHIRRKRLAADTRVVNRYIESLS